MIVKIIVIVVGLIFVVAMGFGSYFFRRKLQELRSVVLVEIADLDDGTCKTTGEVVSAQKPIKSPVGGIACVWFSLVVEEERTYEEQYTEHVGNRRVTRTRPRTEWKEIMSDVRHIDFEIKDDTGEAEIEMDDAEVHIKSKERKSSGRIRDLSEKAKDRLERLYPDHPKALGKKCRYTEMTIEEGDTLLVMGEVTLSKNRPPLFASEKKKPLLISDMSDAELQRHFKKMSLWLAIGAGVFVVLMILGAIFLGGI